MYSRSLEDSVLTLSASGWTYANTFVLYDYETESLWYPFEGGDGLTCISGVHADKFLPESTSYRVRWAEWYRQNPDTGYMACKRLFGQTCDNARR